MRWGVSSSDEGGENHAGREHEESADDCHFHLGEIVASVALRGTGRVVHRSWISGVVASNLRLDANYH